MAGINKERIRKQIVNAINKLPSEIELMRDIKTGPAYEYDKKPIRVATFNAFLNRSTSRPRENKSLTNESSNVEVIANISLLTVWEEEFDIKKDDYFILDGIKHVIVYPKNNYDIYWDCDVEVITDGEFL